MKTKILFTLLILIALAVYLFFYLGIELELKNGIERIGYREESLFNSSFKIRDFSSIQLGIVLLLSIFCLYLNFRKKR